MTRRTIRQVEELAGGLGEEFATSVEASTEAVRDELKMDSGEYCCSR